MFRLACVLLLVAACVPMEKPTTPADTMPARDAEPSAPPPIDAGVALADVLVIDDAGAGVEIDAAAQDAADPVDSGAAAEDADAGAAMPPDLDCDGATMRDADGAEVELYESAAVCEEVLAARGDGVVCGWFELGDRIGPEAWDEIGWRAMNWRTRTGLGRRPHESYQNCLEATRSARGGVVCTNTGVGYKSAHIETNHWCGASSAFSYCLMASVAARDFWVCSFPSEGDGSGPGWTLTHIVGSSCDYQAGGLDLADCNAMVP